MLYYLDAGTLFPGRAEAVTGASLALPDQPSGQFEVLLNREKHGSSAAAWMDFFSDRPVDVIMEDLSCMTVGEAFSALGRERIFGEGLCRTIGTR